jgi:hypothetical protein
MFRFRTVASVLALSTLTLAAARVLPLQEHGMEKPTKEHEMLQKNVGMYEGTVTMFMPGMPETPMPAKETVRSHGPFWTISDFTSEFMGVPYMGHGSNGFDPAKGKYIGTWIDNTSSYLQVMEGTYDEAKKAVVMKWNAPDMTGKVVPHTAEIVPGDHSYTMTFFDQDMQKTMVIAMKHKH